MAKLQPVYYRRTDGSEPVDDFIDTLTIKRQVAIDNQIDRLNLLSSSSPHLPFPHSSQIEGELRELRCHYGSELYRILYRRSRNLIVLLHVFRKDTGRIQREDIEMRRRGGTTSRSEWTPSAGGHRELPATTRREALTRLSKLVS